jgi:hypothetical protein
MSKFFSIGKVLPIERGAGFEQFVRAHLPSVSGLLTLSV